MNIECNPLLSPHPAPVPLLPGVRVHIGEVTPGAVLGPADLLVDVLLVTHPSEAGWSDLIVLSQPQSVFCGYPWHEADSIRGHQRVQACNKY